MFVRNRLELSIFALTITNATPLPKRGSYLITRRDECIRMGKVAILSTLDTNSWYWQIEIEDSNKNKTTYTWHRGLYRFIRMTFELCNAPGPFQRTMDVIPSSVKWHCALVYFDDIVIIDKTPEQHISHVRNILPLLNSAGAILKLMKCSSFTNTIDYLCQVVHLRRLDLASHTANAVRELKIPVIITELRFFWGYVMSSSNLSPDLYEPRQH